MLRQSTRVFAFVLVATGALVVMGCGGGSSSSSSSSSSSATAAATTEAQREQNALPMSQQAAVPKNLKCAAADIVWVNMHTKAYHMAGDPYYGRTKEGQYMCKADADAAGDHPAGKRHKGANNMSSGSTGCSAGASTGCSAGTSTGCSSATSAGTTTIHHHHRRAATPAPAAT